VDDDLERCRFRHCFIDRLPCVQVGGVEALELAPFGLKSYLPAIGALDRRPVRPPPLADVALEPRLGIGWGYVGLGESERYTGAGIRDFERLRTPPFVGDSEDWRARRSRLGLDFRGPAISNER
jgi:hypothetical protein